MSGRKVINDVFPILSKTRRWRDEHSACGAFVVIGIETLYLLGPNVKQRFTPSLPGAIVAVIGWILLSDALSYYFRTFFNLNRTYGVLGGGVALLTWLYWSGFLILLGAQPNSEISRQRGDVSG